MTHQDLSVSQNYRVVDLLERYDVTFQELSNRLSTLEIEPTSINRALWIDATQLRCLDDLHNQIQPPIVFEEDSTLLDEAFLYRCRRCGDLWVSERPLDPKHLHHCRHSKLSERQDGEFEFIASGPDELITGLAHSIMLGLDNLMKGI
ncbi:MAG: hypothetical protein ACFE0J_22825 [Elainellaceae cyanobacterium]